MRFRYAWARLLAAGRFFWPELELSVPPLAIPDPPSAVRPGWVDRLNGYRHPDGTLVLVTGMGVELPVPAGSGWLLIDLVRLVSQIELLPEPDGSRGFVW